MADPWNQSFACKKDALITSQESAVLHLQFCQNQFPLISVKIVQYFPVFSFD